MTEPIKITYDLISRLGACWLDEEFFSAVHSHSVELTRDNALKFSQDVDWWWFSAAFLPHVVAEGHHWVRTAYAIEHAADTETDRLRDECSASFDALISHSAYEKSRERIWCFRQVELAILFWELYETHGLSWNALHLYQKGLI